MTSTPSLADGAPTVGSVGRGVLRAYGPQCAPLECTALDTLRRWGYRPFHGIISRGMLDERVTSATSWEWGAAHLDDLRQGIAPVGSAEALAMVRAADRQGVLTYDASLAVATEAALALVPASGTRHAVELWNPKEGHTSSVWRIRITDDKGRAVVDLAANVARDLAAERELVAIADQLQQATASGSVATPVRLVVHGGTTVLLQPWLDGAVELNPVVGAEGTRLAAVAEFVTDQHYIGRITKVLARPLTAGEHARIGAVAARVLAACPTLTFTPCDGDWVLHEGEPVLVACDPGPTLSWAGTDHRAPVDVAFGLTDPTARAALLEGAHEAVWAAAC